MIFNLLIELVKEIDGSWPRAVRSFNSYCFLIKLIKEIPRPTESVTATPPITPSVASTVVPLSKLQIGDGTPPVASTLVPLSKLQVGSHCQRKSYPHQSGARGEPFFFFNFESNVAIDLVLIIEDWWRPSGYRELYSL